jgi:hypothetical protein
MSSIAIRRQQRDNKESRTDTRIKRKREKERKAAPPRQDHGPIF